MKTYLLSPLVITAIIVILVAIKVLMTAHRKKTRLETKNAMLLNSITEELSQFTEHHRKIGIQHFPATGDANTKPRWQELKRVYTMFSPYELEAKFETVKCNYLAGILSLEDLHSRLAELSSEVDRNWKALFLHEEDIHSFYKEEAGRLKKK